MYGTIYYGGAPFGSTQAPLVVIEAELALAFITTPPLPPWEPILVGSDVEIMLTLLREGEPVEPSGVTCELRSPQAKREALAMTRNGFGAWSTISQPSLPGRWTCRIGAYGSVVGVIEGVFWMANSNL